MKYFVLLLSVTACMPTPPQAPQPRTGTEVNASFAATWDATIDVFAQNNVSIKTLDRASGLIVAEPQRVGPNGTVWADCGKRGSGSALSPDAASWNIVVRGDSTRALVKANVLFVAVDYGVFGDQAPRRQDCSTKGVWEPNIEGQIKTNAETRVAAQGKPK